MIYLDNAATTLYKPQCVYDAVMHAMKNYGNSGRGYTATSLEASRCIFEARKCLTEFLVVTIPQVLYLHQMRPRH